MVQCRSRRHASSHDALGSFRLRKPRASPERLLKHALILGDHLWRIPGPNERHAWHFILIIDAR